MSGGGGDNISHLFSGDGKAPSVANESTTPPTTAFNDSNNTQQQPVRRQSSQNEDQTPSRPGTESIQHLKQIGSSIGSFALNLKPIRDLALAEKLNAMNIELEEQQQQRDILNFRKHLEDQDRDRREKEHASELLARQLQDEEDQDECERIKLEADRACQRVGKQYDSLVKFIESNPYGSYDGFIEFLLVGGSRNAEDGTIDDYNTLLFENFYNENSLYRKLWNDNLTLGLSDHASTIDGRHFAAAIATYDDNNKSGEYQAGLRDSSTTTTRDRTHSEDERNLGQVISERTSSEGERIKKQIGQIDKTKLKQQIGSAFSMVSSIALKPLRDLEMAEKLNAMNLDMEDAKAQREIDQHMRNVEEQQELEEMMRIKKEAEESSMKVTKDHLLAFLQEHPNASYNLWIEE